MTALITILTVIANSILGLAVYGKNHKSATNRIFFLLTITINAWAVSNYFSLQYQNPSIALFWIRIVMVFAFIMFPLLYLLSHTFPSPKILLSKTKLWLIIFLTLSVTLLSLTPAVFRNAILSPQGNITPIPGPIMPLYALCVITFLSLTIYTLFYKRKYASPSLRSQLDLMLTGISLTFILAVVTNFLLVIIFQFTNLVSLGPAYSLILVGFISVAIIRHRFLDITALVFRAVTFTLLIIFIVVIYAGLLFSFLNNIPEPSHTILSIILAVVLAASFSPLKRLVEKLTQKVFYRNPYTTSELLEALGEITRSTLSLTTLGKNTLTQLTQTMHLSRAALVINQGENPPQIVHLGYHQKPNFTPNTLHNLLTATKGKLLIFDDLEESAEKMLLRQEQITVVIPLRVKNFAHGLLILGEKASGEIYSQQDIDVFEILMPQLSIAIQNALSYEEIKGFAATLKEEVNKATADLKQANRHLKHLDKLKDDFVFIATHELKNPVTALKGYLSMLTEGLYGPIPVKMKEPFSQMQYSNQQLVDLVNDLLQIARSEAKTLTINTSAVNILNIIEEVCVNLKPLADQKKLTLTYLKPRKDTLLVMADNARFKEIMNNLISNAIKYSETGIITISHEYNEDKIITHVQDQGYGISPKDQPQIFTRFFRVGEEAAKGIPGTGLGLFIVKQLIEKMHGKIWFNSVYSKGTIFSFSLPKA